MLDDFIQEEINRDTAKVYIGGDGDYIEVISTSDKGFVQLQSRHNKRYKQQLKSDKTSAESLQRIMAPLAAALLVGWKMSATKKAMNELFPDIKCKKLDDERVTVPFSTDNAKAILSHKRNWEFVQFVLDAAKERANFIEEDKEDDEKN